MARNIRCHKKKISNMFYSLLELVSCIHSQHEKMRRNFFFFCKIEAVKSGEVFKYYRNVEKCQVKISRVILAPMKVFQNLPSFAQHFCFVDSDL